jgi:FKBP-type peptidyl-prolyl cis-trans isomerase
MNNRVLVMKTPIPLLALALFALTLASCGESEGTANPAREPETILRIETKPGNEFAYTTTKASTRPGYVAVEFSNPQSTRHNLTFENSSGQVIGATDRIFKTATVKNLRFAPGRYTFYCSLHHHRQAGLEGTLIVSDSAPTSTAPAPETASQTSADATKAPAEPTESHLAKRAPKDAWERTEPKIEARSGPVPKKVIVKDLIKGTGAVIKSGNLFGINWTAVYYKTGKWRESSWETGQKYTFNYGAGQVIEGWEEGLKGMRVGGRRELIVPSKLAYGNGALVYVIDLLSITG